MEEWRDIKGYEGIYQVSSLGRVRSLDRILKNGYLEIGGYKQPSYDYRHGYFQIRLTDYNGVCSTKRLHRIVAENFIPNPNKLPFVNHKNEIKYDNRVENLEWCTRLYNTNYGEAIQKAKRRRWKPVVKIDNEGNIVARFRNHIEAAHEAGVCTSEIWQSIYHPCRCRGYYYKNQDTL